MSARKKVNQSRPRPLADAVALGAAESGVGRADSDGTLSLRGPSSPPSSSSAIVDSSLSPAPQGSYGSGFRPNAPCIGLPSPPRARAQPGRICDQDELVRTRTHMRKEGDFAESDGKFPAMWIWNFCSKATRRASAAL